MSYMRTEVLDKVEKLPVYIDTCYLSKKKEKKRTWMLHLSLVKLNYTKQAG